MDKRRFRYESIKPGSAHVVLRALGEPERGTNKPRIARRRVCRRTKKLGASVVPPSIEKPANGLQLAEADELKSFVKPEAKAKQLFGTTNKVDDAGYVTKSGAGDMINWWAKQQIGQAWDSDARPADPHTAFLRRGNVALDSAKRRIEFETEPTQEQFAAINAFVTRHGGNIDVVFPGRKIRQFHGNTFQQVMQAIVSFFHGDKKESFRSVVSNADFEVCELVREAKASSETLEGRLLHIQDRNGRWTRIIEPDDRPGWRIPFVTAKGLPPIALEDMLPGRYRMVGKSKKDRTFVVSSMEYLGTEQPPDTIEGLAEEKDIVKPEDAAFTRCLPTFWKPKIDFEIGKRYTVKGVRITKFLMRVFDYEQL